MSSPRAKLQSNLGAIDEEIKDISDRLLSLSEIPAEIAKAELAFDRGDPYDVIHMGFDPDTHELILVFDKEEHLRASGLLDTPSRLAFWTAGRRAFSLMISNVGRHRVSLPNDAVTNTLVGSWATYGMVVVTMMASPVQLGMDAATAVWRYSCYMPTVLWQQLHKRAAGMYALSEERSSFESKLVPVSRAERRRWISTYGPGRGNVKIDGDLYTMRLLNRLLDEEKNEAELQGKIGLHEVIKQLVTAAHAVTWKSSDVAQIVFTGRTETTTPYPLPTREVTLSGRVQTPPKEDAFDDAESGADSSPFTLTGEFYDARLAHWTLTFMPMSQTETQWRGGRAVGLFKAGSYHGA